MANPYVTGIVGITLVVIMVTNVFLPTVKNANTSDFTVGELAMWGVVGLAGVIGTAVSVFQVFGLA